jgi:hypothetical protein
MTESSEPAVLSTDFVPPHPGSQQMPRWDAGELPDAPVFHMRNLAAFLGPSVVMAASAIGGGEWLTGPLVTAKYGGALLWLSTLSILGQVVYNIEISRYTLYTGEPIFTGKFRTLPGPMFWLTIYLVLDCGSLLPYLASNAAIPAAAVYMNRLPDTEARFLSATRSEETEDDILAHRFLRLDANGDGVLVMDEIPARFREKVKPLYDRFETTELTMATLTRDGTMLTRVGCVLFLLLLIPLTVGGKIYNSLRVMMTFKLVVVMGFLVFLAVFYSKFETWWEIGSGFGKFGNFPVVADQDINGNGKRDPGEDKHVPKVENIATTWGDGRLFPNLDLTMVGFVVSMIAISGNGGLTNTPISNFTREQGWGMGRHVGAIPSIVGGHAIQLSHVGMVFQITRESLARWTRWVKHVEREQVCLWLPACFLGLALPSMLSVQFLARGTELSDKYQAAAMTADGVGEAVGGAPEIITGPEGTAPQVRRSNLNYGFWCMTLFCGFLVLATSMASTADGVLRRWVDVCWTALPFLRKWDTRHIGKLYFSVLCIYAVLGLFMLSFIKGDVLLIFSGMIYNYALGFSSLHVAVINTVLLPPELRPTIRRRGLLVVFGIFFLTAAVVSSIVEIPKLMKEIKRLNAPPPVVRTA